MLLLLPSPDDKPDAKTIQALAKEMADATIAGEYGKVLDRTYPGIIKLMGGREKALQATQAAMDKVKQQGIAIKSFTAGQPGEFVSEGSHTFVVVPTSMEMTLPQGKIRAKSYLLGISPDGGKSWTFADGNGLRNPDTREKCCRNCPPS